MAFSFLKSSHGNKLKNSFQFLTPKTSHVSLPSFKEIRKGWCEKLSSIYCRIMKRHKTNNKTEVWWNEVGDRCVSLPSNEPTSLQRDTFTVRHVSAQTLNHQHTTIRQNTCRDVRQVWSTGSPHSWSSTCLRAGFYKVSVIKVTLKIPHREKQAHQFSELNANFLNELRPKAPDTIKHQLVMNATWTPAKCLFNLIWHQWRNHRRRKWK